MDESQQGLKKITINIGRSPSSKSSKPESKYTSKELSQILQDQVEIKSKNIKYFYGCWVKCVSVNTRNYKSGGILVNVDTINKTVSLRPINSSSGDIIESTKSNTFYVKKDTEQYKSMQYILVEKEKLKHSVELSSIQQQKTLLELKMKMKKIKLMENELFQEKIKFEDFKYSFFKKVQDGKILIKD